jgi:thiol-disulfide isomerase/thioredoxin
MYHDRVKRSYAVLFVLVIAACGGRPSFPQSTESPLLGKPLPEIKHRSTLDGAPFDPSVNAGKPVLVKFFAEYCKPCVETLPAAERVHQAHPEVVFLGIDEDDSPDTARTMVKRYNLTFPVIHDRENILSGRFRVATMPATFVTDASGVVRWVGAENQTEKDIERAVSAARP